MTLVLVGTAANYTTDDLEDLIYKDIGDKWTLTGDLTKAKVFGTTVKADMVNRPNFNQPHWIWVKHRRTSAARNNSTANDFKSATLGSKGNITYQSTFEISIFNRRLIKPALTFPELGQMAREVERIIWEYPTNQTLPEIHGVQFFDNWIQESINEATNLGEGFAGTYRLVITIDALYTKGFTP